MGLFGSSVIRGVVNSEFTPELATDLMEAHCVYERGTTP